jgi:hypothetical protein
MALGDRLRVRENEPQRPCGYFWEGVNRMFDMKRRQLITLLGGAVAWPLAARAQQKLPTIGFLGTTTASAWGPWTAAFVQRLRELGWIEGRNLALRRDRCGIRPAQGRCHCDGWKRGRRGKTGVGADIGLSGFDCKPSASMSHLAAAIALALVENGWRVLFMRTSDLVQRLQIARRELALESALAKLDKYHLLILDDIVYVNRDQAETSVLFELIGSRYERRSMLITSNQPFGEWGKVFPEPTLS